MPWSEKVNEQFGFGKCREFLMLCTTVRVLRLGQFCFLSVRVQIYIFCFPAKNPYLPHQRLPWARMFLLFPPHLPDVVFPTRKKHFSIHQRVMNRGWRGTPSSPQIRDNWEEKIQKSNSYLKRDFVISGNDFIGCLPCKLHVLVSKTGKADICLQFCEDTGTFPREGQGCHSPYGRIGGEVSPFIFL